MMKRAWLAALAVVMVMGGSAAQNPRYVFLFIGDGMSMPQRMSAEEFSVKTGKGKLAMNNLPYQATTRTRSANALVTDSAAAATAIACGEKTCNGAVGVDHTRTNHIYSCAFDAKRLGRKVGIVTTVTINHATPAGFYGHRASRSDGYGLGLDLIASGFDYFAGGGLSGHNSTNHPSYRGDIYALAPSAGYNFIRQDRATFDALKPGVGKVWYVASEGTMPYAIDAVAWQGVPTLAELTAKGIELMQDNERGFFMMVEGGKIDYAGHANDAAVNLRDLLALDDAVKVALDFQKRHPDTLVVVTGDHETGGMTVGFAGVGNGFHIELLANQLCSVERFSSVIKYRKLNDFAEVRPLIERNFRFDFTPENWKALEVSFSADVEATLNGMKENEAYDAVKLSKFPGMLRRIVSTKCGIGWSTGSHTALPVLTTAKGVGAERFAGFIDNTDISKKLKELVR